MAPSSSDSDSPKSSSSSGSSNAEGDESRLRGQSNVGSPSNAHQSSDESTSSSDGVLVELPRNPDHDGRGVMPGDAVGGIFVNIDGSMQEGREDLFVDASDEMGSARSVALDESVAMIDYVEGEGSVESPGSRTGSPEDVGRMRGRLKEALVECQKYKAEREVFTKDFSALHHQLQDMLYQSAPRNVESVECLRQLRLGGGEEEAFTSPMPLHSMVNDCSKILSHLQSILNGQLNSELTIKELNAEVENLSSELAVSSMCKDVIVSYLGSIQEIWSNSLKKSSDEVSNRLLASLETVTWQERSLSEDSIGDGISLVERKTLSLIEKHTQLLSEMQQLKQFLAESRPELLTSEDSGFGSLFSIFHAELVETRGREASLSVKISELEDENRKMAEEANKLKESWEAAAAETSKTKEELEHAENKLAVAREKLSIAVTKGKSLVQHRDALKQSVAEKTSELEKCNMELQQKSSALEATESSIEELKQLLTEKTDNLENCLLELQQKTNALEAIETSSLELNQSLVVKTSELEKCLLELQQKSEALGNTEASIQELKQSLAEKIGELDKCFLELRQKSDALESVEINCEEVKQLLSEKNDELEKHVLELQQRSNALQATEASAEELRQTLARATVELQQKSDALYATEVTAEELRETLAQKTDELENSLQKLQELQKSESTFEELKTLLAEKVNELEKCQIELQQKSDMSQTARETTEERKDAQNLINSLQESLSEKNRILQEVAEIMQHGDSQELLPATEIVDSVKWFVSHKHESDAVISERNRIKDTLSSIDLPESVSSFGLDSQIDWLAKSFSQVKEDVIKLQEESAGCKASLISHESMLSEARKEIDHLVASLSEVKRDKDSLQGEQDHLLKNFKTLVEKLFLISSEKDGLANEPSAQYSNSLDDQPSLDTQLLVETCISKIGDRMNTYLSEREKYEGMQTLLYLKCQEQMLCENILEEEKSSRSETVTLATKLVRTSEEVSTLRNEKEALQKELERVEGRSSLIREKLSMAVKKGKGLVQECEGLKNYLRERNSEIEKLKEELQHQESAMVEYQEQIKKLSAYPDHIQKLESDIASLKEIREQSELLLAERNNMVRELVKSIEDIALPIDKTFEKPIEKLYWITEHIRESEVAKAHRIRELEEVQEAANLQSSQLNDAFTTITNLKDDIAAAEEHINSITKEMKDVELSKLSLEQELGKLKELSSLQASKLADAYVTVQSLEDQLSNHDITTGFEKLKEESSTQSRKLEEAYSNIKSLEEALAQATSSISNLQAEKDDIESKSQEQIDALNVKLADCMEELVRTQGSLEDQSQKLVSYLGDLMSLINNDHLFSLMNDEFTRKAKDFKQMGVLIQELHDQFIAKGLRFHADFEKVPSIAILSSLPKLGDITKMFNQKFNEEDLDDTALLSKIVEGLQYQEKLLENNFQQLSRYLDDHVAIILQALQATRHEFIHMLELSDSLKLRIDKLEAVNQDHHIQILSLEKEVITLLSACQDATQVLDIEFSNLLEFCSEHDINNVSFGSESSDVAGQEGGGKYAKAAESLLLATRKIGIQVQKLMSVTRTSMTSAIGLEEKLKQANLTAIQDKQSEQERVLKLEGNLAELQSACSVMKSKIEDQQVNESILRDKDARLQSLQNALDSRDKGIASVSSDDQFEAVIAKVNNMAVPLSESQIGEVHFSSPVEKLFYVLDNFSELQRRVDSLTYEKEDMQLILESHIREIDHQKKAAETVGTNYQDLESKKLDLIELTVGLEKLIRRFGHNSASDDPNLISTTGFLPLLERLMMTLYNELEISKSKTQELEAKLQAKENAVDELSIKNKLLEDSVHARLSQTDVIKERTVYDASTASMGSEISETEDVGLIGKNSISPPNAHVRTMRKGSTDHLVLNVGSDSEPLISAQETDDKGHVFKSLNASGLIPKQGKVIADRVDGIWVSGGRILMNKPGARLGLIAYWMFLHLWLLGSIL